MGEMRRARRCWCLARAQEEAEPAGAAHTSVQRRLAGAGRLLDAEGLCADRRRRGAGARFGDFECASGQERRA